MADKQNYEVPSILIVELKTRGLICASGTLDVEYGEETL